jgi:Na+/melibiose symporter-like transporter
LKPAKDPARLPAGELLAYGLPGLPLAALQLPLFIFLPAYYAEGLGVGFAAVGAVLLAARLFDVVTDPLVGLLSDRLNSRIGRRKPWILLGTPVLLVASWALFVPPEGIAWPYLLIWTMAIYLAGTFVLLPYQAWGAELSPDYHERSRISAAREVCVVIGTLAAVGIPPLIAGDPGGSLELIAWGLTFALPAAVAIALWRLREPAQPARLAQPRVQAWRILLSNGPFRRLIAAYLLNGIANGLPATLFILFVTRVLELPQEVWVGPLLAIYFLCGILAAPVWVRLSARYGKHRVWIGAMIWACCIFVWVPLLGPGDAWWFLAICVLTGISLGADLVLPASMQADVVDLDTLRSGRRRAGLYFALWGMATKLALALAVGIAFPILGLAGFDEQSGASSPFGLLVLALLYSVVPVAFKLAAIWLTAGYPLTAAKQKQIRGLIEKRAARV